jgi:hypothetical protein
VNSFSSQLRLLHAARSARAAATTKENWHSLSVDYEIVSDRGKESAGNLKLRKSERQKRGYPNVATVLHDAIRRQLTEGAFDPVLIASEVLREIEKLTGQIESDEGRPVPADDRHNRLRRALGFVTSPTRGSQNADCALNVVR